MLGLRLGQVKVRVESRMNAAARRQTWIQEQRLLKQKLVCNDSFSWAPYFRSSNEQAVSSSNEQVVVSSSNQQQQQLAVSSSNQQQQQLAVSSSNQQQQQLAVSSSNQQQQQAEQSQKESLKFIGGMDISFVKEDPKVACSALVVLDVNTMSPVYEDFEIFTLELPYIPGFLAFRECPALLRLLKKMKQVAPKKYPQLLMIDGNGILHPRGLGLASHLGVLADIPSVGIGKTLFQVDGLDEHVVKRLARKSLLEGGEWMKMVGRSGKVWGAALRSTQECVNPVFVSVGHRISLETAVEITRRCCLFRIPEPVRQADKKSREYLRLHCYTQS